MEESRGQRQLQSSTLWRRPSLERIEKRELMGGARAVKDGGQLGHAGSSGAPSPGQVWAQLLVDGFSSFFSSHHGQAGSNLKITPNFPLQTINPTFSSKGFPELLSRSLSHPTGFQLLGAPACPPGKRSLK